MTSSHIPFWIALLECGDDHEDSVRLWNGYIHTRYTEFLNDPRRDEYELNTYVINAPENGWPMLTDDEREVIESIAERTDGHPGFDSRFMDFSGHTFESEANFSDLVLIDSNFKGAHFKRIVHFDRSTFQVSATFDEAHFHHQAFFHGAQFLSASHFFNTKFDCGASFADANFDGVWFTGAEFSGDGFGKGAIPEILVSFGNVKFGSYVDFRETIFGSIEEDWRRGRFERVVDFSGAEFVARTSFTKATFGGVPAFFDAALYDDTEFDGVVWDRKAARRIRASYAVRAWERLELMMSQLEKPQDRHRFFRFKMRARRQTDGVLLNCLNWLFEITSDYGWGVSRALISWLAHWISVALLLFGNACFHAVNPDVSKLAWSALGTSFANAHAFLGLAREGGYLAASRELMASHDVWGLLPVIGTVQSMLGPVFLFLLLLTLRNRYRLA